MEAKQPAPELSLQPFDPEVFQRVWNRVMPNQEHSPIVVKPAAVPALSPLLEQPPEAVPEPSRTCLGESSRPYLPILQSEMEQTQGLIRTLQLLSRRTHGRAAPVLSSIASDLRRDLRRLSTAHFLITGNRYTPSHPGTVLSGSLEQALRTLFQQFHQRSAQAHASAQEINDPCLQQLFLDLGDQSEFSRDRLRNLLETLP